MVRKKKKHQEDPADDILNSSSDEVGDAAEGGSAGCSHQRGSIGLRRLRQQVLRNAVRLDVCDDCESSEAQPETWLCLQCGYRGCGGTTKHGVRHSETPHSDSHALALSGQTLQLWCFPCNNWVEANPQVTQIVQNLKKKMASSSKRAKAAQVEDKKLVAEATCIEAGSGDTKEQKVPCGSWTAVKGLSNLGNTCYFNAVLQARTSVNLGQTPLLQPLLAKRCASKLQCTFDPGAAADGSDIPELSTLNVELPGPGPLTSALALFLQEFRVGTPHPRALFSRVCQVAPHFRGHQQHDSHELLRHLLEGVRTEEVKRQKQAVLQAFGLSSKVDPNKVEPDTKAKIQAYKKAVARTPLDDIFGGILLSTIVCQQCGKVSRREETFQDLSLPIPEEKTPRGGAGAHSTPRGKGARRKALEGGSSATTARTPNREALSGGSIDPTEADEEDNGSPGEEQLTAQMSNLHLHEPAATKGPAEGSLEACLRSFTAPELLAGANGLHCEGCKSARAAASLQLQVFKTPRVLTLHLKRFQQGATLRKVQKHVPFPVELDVTPFCCRDAEVKASETYTLYGVVEHAGRMTGGHYTAYVRGAGGSWFHASDSRVVPATQQKVLASQAYLLFYCRADTLQE
ncbi:ubiquitin carboxyl-terminal hydrolase 16-like [Dermacentor albipictus]|uniref:ubiquitin carboxyl-terminal hydrolase 16-like n=1 Tax=Dermacentor albipictus TaxID=60249 RepID=UPI0031FBD71F